MEATEEMRAGLALEDHLASEYQRTTGREIATTQQLVYLEDENWCHATVDAITTDGRMVEFKAVGHRTASRLDPDGDPDSLPEGWILQVHQGMHIMGTDECDVFLFVGSELKTRLYTVPYRKSLDEAARKVDWEFWKRHVIAGIPPEEFQPGDVQAIKRAFREETGERLVWGEEELYIATRATAFRVERLTCEKLAKEAGDNEEEFKAMLLMRVGNASGAELPDGWSVSRKVRERRGYTVEASKYVDFRINPPKTGEKE